MPPTTTVVIAVHNGGATLGDQLAALRDQVDPPPFEVLVMDNNSTDDAASLAAGFGGLDLRVIPATDHQGQCYARNLGVLLARGRNVLVCDQDDVVAPTWVRALTDELERRRCLVTSPIELAAMNPEAVWRTYVGGQDPEHVVRPFVVQGHLPFAYGCNLGIRRDDWIRLGGMDNSYRGGDEDTDFSWRAQEAGLPLVCVEDTCVHYRLRGGVRPLFHQRRGYARTRVLTWVRSHETRQLSGMSLRWTLREVALVPLRWVRRSRTPEGAFRWATHAGSVVGNLEGQLRYRWGRTPTPELIDRARPEAERRLGLTA